MKTGGLKVVFTLLNHPDMVNWPYHEIADTTGVALGTVGWIFRDRKEMGFTLETGKRKRKMVDTRMLLKRWAEAYPDQLRPRLVIERFRTDIPFWWEHVDIMEYGGCWGVKWPPPS